MSDYEYEFLDRPSAPSPQGKRRRPKPSGRQPNSPRRGGCITRIIGTLLYLILAAMIVGMITAVGGYLYLSNELSGAIDRLASYRSVVGGTPRFYDRHGTLLFELETTEKRRQLQYEEIPEFVIRATVAVEDDTFWTNWGVDPAAIGAAVWYNYQNQDSRPVGASTITQQLVRHIAFSYEERVTASYERKLREIFLALILNQERSKQDILQMYLNEIYYGNLAYGIEAAAQTYFGKPAGELSLAESAFLAGLPQAPIQLNPYTNFTGAKQRQVFILDLMTEDGLIDATTAEVSKAIPIELRPLIDSTETGPQTLLAPHFILYVKDQLERQYGPDAISNGGWQITTSLDLNVQHMAEEEARNRVAERATAHDVSNASVVVLKPSTAEILAMVGSLNYFEESIDGQINMATTPRQPGSTFKPITFVAAMEKGWSSADVIWDVPIELEVGWDSTMTPTNYDNRYHGPTLFRDALANSYNIPPLQLARDIGLPTVIGTGRKMGILSLNETPGYYGLSLTLGGGEVPLLEMTHAYATLANSGRHNRLTSVLKITDSQGNLIYDDSRARIPGNQILDPAIAYIITDILDDDQARVAAMGRGSALELPFPAAAKTGTTNDFRDNLTIGYSPAVVVGVWMGNTDNRPMRDSSGLRGAAPLWNRIMQRIYDDGNLGRALLIDGIVPPIAFERPGNVIEQPVCLPWGTGGGSCTSSRTDLAIANAPTHGVGRLGYAPDVRSVPGAWQLTVLPMPAAEAAKINQPPLSNGFAPPAPRFCVTNQNVAGAQTRLFLQPPPFYPDEVRARLWAKQNGRYLIAPPIACPLSLTRPSSVGNQTNSRSGGIIINNSGSSSSTSGGGGAFIASPRPGATVSGVINITGSANVAGMQYYKLEIGSGSSPSSWTTFGTTHSGAVNNGVLETLQAGALPPGPYVIRLVVVKEDGNFDTPYQVPIKIE